jgi:hypothetical protein
MSSYTACLTVTNSTRHNGWRRCRTPVHGLCQTC